MEEESRLDEIALRAPVSLGPFKIVVYQMHETTLQNYQLLSSGALVARRDAEPSEGEGKVFTYFLPLTDSRLLIPN